MQERSIKEFIKNYPATSMILFVTVLLHLMSYVLGNGATDAETARQFGALYSSNKDWTELPYLLMSTYQHIGGMLHLLFNVSFILISAPLLEEVYGTVKFAVLYNLTGVFGSLVTLIFEQNVISSGASAAGYGLLGVYVALIVKQHPLIYRENKQSIISMIVIGIVMTFTVPNISITGHLGGLLAGMLLGMMLSTKHTVEKNFINGVVKTFIVTGLILFMLSIPKTTVTDKNFIEVAHQVGLGDYVTGEKTLTFLSSKSESDNVNNEILWLSNNYNNHLYNFINLLIDAYNDGNAGNSVVAIETIESTKQSIDKQIQELEKHKSVQETEDLQQQLLSIYHSLNQSTNTLLQALQTMDSYDYQQYIQEKNGIIASCESFVTALTALQNSQSY